MEQNSVLDYIGEQEETPARYGDNCSTFDVCSGLLKIYIQQDAESDEQECRRCNVESRCKSAATGDRPAGDEIDVPGEKNETIAKVTLQVPEQFPLNSGSEPVTDDKDVDRDKEENALENKGKRKRGFSHGF